MKTTFSTPKGDLTISVEGTQQHPELRITTKGFETKATLQHWTHKRLAKGIYLQKFGAYIENEKAHNDVSNMIENLPNEIVYLEKVSKPINADGDIIERMEWNIPIMKTSKGTFVSPEEIERFLDSKNIMKITKEEALELWTNERESIYNQERKETIKSNKNIYTALTVDDDSEFLN